MISILMIHRLLLASSASAITFRVTITMDYLAPERITELVNVESVFANPAGKVPTVLAETAPILALRLVSFGTQSSWLSLFV